MMEISYDRVIEMNIDIVDNMICFRFGEDVFLQPADIAIELANHIQQLANSIIEREKYNGIRQVQ